MRASHHPHHPAHLSHARPATKSAHLLQLARIEARQTLPKRPTACRRRTNSPLPLTPERRRTFFPDATARRAKSTAPAQNELPVSFASPRRAAAGRSSVVEHELGGVDQGPQDVLGCRLSGCVLGSEGGGGGLELVGCG